MNTQFAVGQIAVGQVAVINGVRMRYVGDGKWTPVADEQLLAKRFDPAEEWPLHKVPVPCT